MEEFNYSDKVTVLQGSNTDTVLWQDHMNKLVGNTVTLKDRAVDGGWSVYENNWIFHESWLELVSKKSDENLTQDTINELMLRNVELEKVNKMYREELCKLRVIKGFTRQIVREYESGKVSGLTLIRINNLLGVER